MKNRYRHPLPKYEPDPLQLASLAALIDPAGAKNDPVRAVLKAREVLSAAQDDINAALLKEKKEKEAPFEAQDRLWQFAIPGEPWVTTKDAFKRWPSGYKTEGRFLAALQKAGLCEKIDAHLLESGGFDCDWWTTESLVSHLAELKRKWMRQRDRDKKSDARKEKEQNGQDPMAQQRATPGNKRKSRTKIGAT